MKLSKKSYTYSSSAKRTYADIKISFKVNGVLGPSSLKDIIGVVWNKDFIYNRSGSSLNVRYVNTSSGSTSSKTFTPQVDTLSSVKIIMPRANAVGYPSGKIENTIISSGDGNIKLSKQGKRTEFSILTKYGYNKYSVSPGISISGTGPSVGISFTSGISDIGRAVFSPVM